MANRPAGVRGLPLKNGRTMPSKTERQRKATRLAQSTGISYTAALRVIDAINAPDADYAVTGKPSQPTSAPGPRAPQHPDTASIFRVEFTSQDYRNADSVSEVVQNAMGPYPNCFPLQVDDKGNAVIVAKKLDDPDQPAAKKVTLQVDPGLGLSPVEADFLLEKAYPAYRIVRFDADTGWANLALKLTIPTHLPFNQAASLSKVGLAFGAGPDFPEDDEVRTAQLPLGHSLMIAGATASGKTVAARALVASALLKDWEVSVIDLASQAADYMAFQDDLTNIASSLEGAYTVLRGIEQERQYTYNLVLDHGAKSFAEIPEAFRPSSILVVIEEVRTIIDPEPGDREQTSVLRAECHRLIRTLAHVGKGLGVSVVVTSQKFGRDFALGTADRLLMGRANLAMASEFLRTTSEYDQVHPMPRGRGFFEGYNERGHEVQTWFSTDDAYTEMVRGRHD